MTHIESATYHTLDLPYPVPTTKPPWLGLPIGVNDRNGNPIHIGDTLHFDPAEPIFRNNSEVTTDRITVLEKRVDNLIGEIAALKEPR